jgi:hypothetical protein
MQHYDFGVDDQDIFNESLKCFERNVGSGRL